MFADHNYFQSKSNAGLSDYVGFSLNGLSKEKKVSTQNNHYNQENKLNPIQIPFLKKIMQNSYSKFNVLSCLVE